MGGLALTRENALVFIAVLLAWSLVGVDRGRPGVERRTTNVDRLRGAAVFLAGIAIVLVPVAARNAYVGGGFYLTTSQFGPNFYIGNNPSADGTYQSLRFGRGAPEYERQDATELAETRARAEALAGRGLELLDRQGARVHHEPARRLAEADGPEVRAARERHRDARHRKPGGARRMVVAAEDRRLVRTLRRPRAARRARPRPDLAAAVAALGRLCDDHRLRRKRRRVLCVRALPVSAGPAADRLRRRRARSRAQTPWRDGDGI